MLLRLRLAGPRSRSFYREHGPQESVARTGPASILLLVTYYCRAIAQLAIRGLGWLLAMVLRKFVTIGNRVE